MVHIREKVRQRKLKEKYVQKVLGKIIRGCETCKRAEPYKKMAREGKTMAEIAEAFGVSRQAVHDKLSNYSFREDRPSRSESTKKGAAKRGKREKKVWTPEKIEQKRVKAAENAQKYHRKRRELGYKILHLWLPLRSTEQIQWLARRTKRNPTIRYNTKLKERPRVHRRKLADYSAVIMEAIEIYCTKIKEEQKGNIDEKENIYRM